MMESDYDWFPQVTHTSIGYTGRNHVGIQHQATQLVLQMEYSMVNPFISFLLNGLHATSVPSFSVYLCDRIYLVPDVPITSNAKLQTKLEFFFKEM